MPMTTVPPAPPPGGAVVRSAWQVAALRANAERAVAAMAARTGRPPGTELTGAIDWATGAGGTAPFTGTPGPADLAAEAAACSRYLKETRYSEQAAPTMSWARQIQTLLEWLTGASDRPPAYAAGTQPGDITGGRGLIVRTPAETAAMAALARTRRDSGTDPEGWASGPGWYAGVAAALEWAGGQRADPPMSHPDAHGCSHPVSAGLPEHREIARVRGQAEEHLQREFQHGSHSPAYADGVLASIRWLYGETTDPPAR
jgi:hypothetical protein